MITQERLNKLKAIAEFVDAANEVIPELVAEIERMHEVVRDAVTAAKKNVVKEEVMTAEARAAGINVYGGSLAAKYDALKKLADQLGVILS